MTILIIAGVLILVVVAVVVWYKLCVPDILEDIKKWEDGGGM
jgi:hypothetical protein